MRNCVFEDVHFLDFEKLFSFSPVQLRKIDKWNFYGPPHLSVCNRYQFGDRKRIYHE